jgi:hypothetical protein
MPEANTEPSEDCTYSQEGKPTRENTIARETLSKKKGKFFSKDRREPNESRRIIAQTRHRQAASLRENANEKGAPRILCSVFDGCKSP